ncbi:MAG: (d)CMP kinase [Candidatus Helarchaeota archaeon]
MNLVIAIAGLHGTGKSEQARRIASSFNLDYVSIGSIFRELAEKQKMKLEQFSKYCEENPEIDNQLDELITQKAKQGKVVIDSQLSAWKSGQFSDLNIFLTAPLDVRVQRIANRDGTSFEEAKKETIIREKSEKLRYLKMYEIDIENYTIYDLIINTDLWSIDGVQNIIKTAIEDLIKNKKSGE